MVMIKKARGMLRVGTPIEDYRERFGLWVKREDLSCPPPGPPFSKTRGVFAHLEKRPEHLIGVLDTFHSQAGHAVARACQVLGKKCWNYFPKYKSDEGKEYLRPPQIASADLGAVLVALKAGRSCILYHQARKDIEEKGGYMMPNALKLPESVEETAKEVPAQPFDWVLIPASSGTIAAGVIRGFGERVERGDIDRMPRFIVHLGYSRSETAVREYLYESSGYNAEVEVIDEGYAYKDVARPGLDPDWPCNAYYDLKAFRWWTTHREEYPGDVLLWNVG